MDIERKIRLWLLLFMAGLLLSGLTAFPLEWETRLLDRWAHDPGVGIAGRFPELADWLARVHEGLGETYARYPFVAYGTDWLAFAHLVIAVAFLGPLRDPVRNVWVVEFGMIACALVIPLALIAGPLRGIPWFWRVIDCWFGLLGLVPLVLAYRLIRRLPATPSTQA